jgi:hypothetical protein
MMPDTDSGGIDTAAHNGVMGGVDTVAGDRVICVSPTNRRTVTGPVAVALSRIAVTGPIATGRSISVRGVAVAGIVSVSLAVP